MATRRHGEMTTRKDDDMESLLSILDGGANSFAIYSLNRNFALSLHGNCPLPRPIYVRKQSIIVSFYRVCCCRDMGEHFCVHQIAADQRPVSCANLHATLHHRLSSIAFSRMVLASTSPQTSSTILP